MKLMKNKLSPILRSLSSRNFRLFFMGQGISLIGNWITQIATIWLVYQLTNDPLMLGVIGFSSQIPSFFLTPVGGIFVDRWSRQKILLTTQILSTFQSLTLAFLAFTGIQIWQIIVLSVFQGLINAFDMPARQAFVTEMVEKKEDLGNAIALNSSLFNGARLIGPAIGGLLIAAVGAGACFLIDGISYIAVIISLLAMKVKPRNVSAIDTNPLQRLKEGFVYAYSFAPIRSILILISVVSFMGMSYTVLVPVFATQILHGNSETLGYLMAASGVGAFSGAIYLSSRQSVLGLGKIIAVAPAIWGIGLIAFSFSRFLWLSLLMMFFIGLGSILAIASSNTFLQTIVEDDKRGRLMSLFTMSFMGMVPLGNLLAGSIASHIGASYTLAIAGIFCILGGLIFYTQLPALKPLVRPIYKQLGIIR